MEQLSWLQSGVYPWCLSELVVLRGQLMQLRFLPAPQGCSQQSLQQAEAHLWLGQLPPGERLVLR